MPPSTFATSGTPRSPSSCPTSGWRGATPTARTTPGVVTFHRLDDSRSLVMVQMDFVPEGIKEKIGDALGAPDRRVKGGLQRCKELIESRGSETGAWRGEVPRES